MLVLMAACSRAPDLTQLPASPTDAQVRETPTKVHVQDTPADATVPATEEPVSSPLPTLTPLPTAVPAPFLGQSVLGVELAGKNIVSKIPRAAESGAFWVRWNGILWAEVEPNQGERNWETLSDFETQAQALAASNLKAIVIVRSAPAWAQAVPGKVCGPIKDDQLDAFGNFMFDLVSRYSQEPYNVKYWELGNEPDVDPSLVPDGTPFGCMGNVNDPLYGGGDYARLLQAVYPRVKAADPEAQVLVGGLLLDCDPVNPPETFPGSGLTKYCDPSRYLEGILANGGGDFFDGISFHAYDFYYTQTGFFGNGNWHSGYGLSGLYPVLVAKVRYLKNVLAQYGYYEKMLFNTETALICGVTGKEAECQDGGFERMKADYVPMTYAAALAEGLEGNIWFRLVGGWRGSGLMRDGSNPLSAFSAYQFAVDSLSGAIFWGPLSDIEGVIGYKFRKGELETWVLWSQDGSARQINLNGTPAGIYSALGVSQDPTQILEITVSPLYVEWQP